MSLGCKYILSVVNDDDMLTRLIALMPGTSRGQVFEFKSDFFVTSQVFGVSFVLLSKAFKSWL